MLHEYIKTLKNIFFFLLVKMFDGNLLLIGYLYTEDLIDHIYDEKTIICIYITGEFEADLKINATWDPKYEDKNSTEYKDLTERFRNQV